VQKLLKRFNGRALSPKAPRRARDGAPYPVKAFAHITGGGFVDNIPRVLPKNLDVVIRKGSWDMLPIFKMIKAKGGVPEAELYQVFNMGIGMVAIVSGDKTDAILKLIRAQKHKAWLIGEVVKGCGKARVI
jgi:phosphoribosylformylglycinamidine cyclo-ligase